MSRSIKALLISIDDKMLPDHQMAGLETISARDRRANRIRREIVEPMRGIKTRSGQKKVEAGAEADRPFLDCSAHWSC
jgi:hypothetical protein